MNNSQLNELLYQALETEIGGQAIYKSAIECAANEELAEEWRGYLDETTEHEQILRELFGKLGLDPESETTGRAIVRIKSKALIEANKAALKAFGKSGAQLTASESVVESETKDHQNWELIGRCAEALSGDKAAALKEAYDQVEEQEDQHLYHTMGWSRELWIEALGMPAVLPPPEEAKKVVTAIGAARAEHGRDAMLKKR
jgi:rubrerythrin